VVLEHLDEEVLDNRLYDVTQVREIAVAQEATLVGLAEKFPIHHAAQVHVLPWEAASAETLVPTVGPGLRWPVVSSEHEQERLRAAATAEPSPHV
jgi:hypothetical protein